MRLIPKCILAALVSLYTISLAQPALASPGHFKGLILDQAGRPLGDILVAFLKQSPVSVLPVLTKSDQKGWISASNLEAGNYEIKVKSGRYRIAGKRLIEVLPGETTIARLVLQQLLGLGSSQEQNLTVKTLLRNSEDHRLVFRNLPGPPGEMPFPEFLRGDSVVQVMGGAGLNGDHLVFPAGSAGGTTTNFALLQEMGGNIRYVFAGQLNSGEDSLWRLKNFVRLPLSDIHSLEAYVGYGRLSFEQPSLALLDNPGSLGDHLGYTRAVGTTKILSAGLQDQLLLGERLAFLWGVELNRLDGDQRGSYVSPSAELSYSPKAGTTVQLLMTSKRPTHTGSLQAPDGSVVNLTDAVYFSRVGDRFRAGTPTYYRTGLSQQLTDDTEVELAVFENELFGGMVPLLVVSDQQPSSQIWYVNDDQADNRGYKVGLRRRFGTINAYVAYVRGTAAGVDWDQDLMFSQESISTLFPRRHSYHSITTQLEAYIPSSKTHLNALVNFVPHADPITGLDTYSDRYEAGNEGVNLFVRQFLPLPTEWLTFLGLDFLSAYQIEALLDIRNLTNRELAKVRTDEGEVSLVRNPRTVRGGISVRF